ncbi:DNA (cytosine-5)-methyltransferase CMT3 [Coffea arabica]|uniref:DNA (cytosine-5-)-methyltransferase n=1 Tax=Coffea arabica TaxID=13443 RepID=A0A6P6TET2_COFAR
MGKRKGSSTPAASREKSRASSFSSSVEKKSKRQRMKVESVPANADSDFMEEPDVVVVSDDDEREDGGEVEGESLSMSPAERKTKRRVLAENEEEGDFRFLGEPVADKEARCRWPHRYAVKQKRKQNAVLQDSKGEDDSEEFIDAKRHFTQAEVDGQIFNLEDDAYVQAEEGKRNYICKIVEMFEGTDGMPYFTAQWFYRAEDTIITDCHVFIDEKRVFFSEVKNDNPLDCLVKRLRIARLPPNMDLECKDAAKSNCDYYYDMMFLLPHCTFMSLPPENNGAGSDSGSTISSEADAAGAVVSGVEVSQEANHLEMRLLDLYSGCGAMSTGLCLGANSTGVKLVTKWAVDINKYACESLKWNHPETEVRNESAENFLLLIKEWERLCVSYALVESNVLPHPYVNSSNEQVDEVGGDDEDDDVDDSDGNSSEVFEVKEVLAMCYGDPKESGAVGLYCKIRWNGYGPDDETWEPIDGLSDCQEKVKEFVTKGYKRKILPLPGNVDVICGGPPCQGISGFNRFRNTDQPLQDEKNKQLAVFMDIVAFLKPRFVLMENVVDLIKFSKGYLGRYAFARLLAMNYQARLGMMAAGAYGLPQFRMRVFMWGAVPKEKLPQYPLPTHDVVVRGVVPKEFESNTVAYEEGSKVELEEELFLEDAISDLPPVENDEPRDEMPYGGASKTEFQNFIRLRKDEMPGSLGFGLEVAPHLLYDHRPLQLNRDDYSRVCQIPKKKGANFRDLPGVRVRADNKVEWDPDIERVYLPSGKPLVPDYAMTFVGGSSCKPFGRLWWNETVPTVVTRAEPHNQTILHPKQDRVLTIRENARLQGFPDYYKLFGPIKERYIQVGNAVAVPVARALGFSLALALKGLSGDEPVLQLPKSFPNNVELPAEVSS